MLGHFDHYLPNCATEVCGRTVLLLGGIVLTEVVENHATVVHHAPAHEALNGEVLVEGGRTDTGEVGRGVPVVMAYTIHLVGIVVGNDFLSPLSVPHEQADLSVMDGEVAESGVTTTLCGYENHTLVTCGEGVCGRNHASEQITLFHRGNYALEHLIQTFACDFLLRVLVNLGVHEGFQILVVHTKNVFNGWVVNLLLLRLQFGRWCFRG